MPYYRRRNMRQRELSCLNRWELSAYLGIQCRTVSSPARHPSSLLLRPSALPSRRGGGSEIFFSFTHKQAVEQQHKSNSNPWREEFSGRRNKKSNRPLADGKGMEGLCLREGTGISKSINGNLTNEVGWLAGGHEPRGVAVRTAQVGAEEDAAEPARRH